MIMIVYFHFIGSVILEIGMKKIRIEENTLLHDFK